MAGVLPQSDCLVLANPSAAAVSAAVAQEIEGWLSLRTRTVRTVWTQAPGHAAELAREHAGAGLIVTVGGDGTVSELVPGMTGHQILCPLPAGSGTSTAAQDGSGCGAAGSTNACVSGSSTPSAPATPVFGLRTFSGG